MKNKKNAPSALRAPKSGKPVASAPAAPARMEFKPVRNFADLAAAFAVPVTARMVVNGQGIEVTGRRLRPDESRMVKLLMEETLPPELPREEGEDGEKREPRYDFRDPAYLAKRDEMHRRARAVALWQAFPMFQQEWERRSAELEKGTTPHPQPPACGTERVASEAAGPPDQAGITKFIENLDIDEDGLQYLFGRLTQNVVLVETAANFS